MKILYCHDNVYLHSEFGDVYSQGQFPYAYFTPFIEAFGEITVVGRGKPLDKNYDLRKLNVSSGPDVDFALLPNINSLTGLYKNLRAVNGRMKQLVAEADGVIIRAVSDLGWLAFRHALAMRKPVAMEMAACAWDSTWNHGNPYGKLYAPVRYLRDKTIARHADCVLYVSQNFLQSRYPARGVTACASNVRIDQPNPLALTQRLEKIEAYGADDILSIGLIGTLGHKLKGIHTALEALRNVQRREPNRFIFKILGPGNPERYRAMAEALGLQHCVFFDGVIQSGAEVLSWLKEIDIYLQPSFQEGVPRATIEAMSVGCPAIGSTAGGIPELLPPEWLHTPGDAAMLESLIERMLGNKALRQEAAIRNFERAKFYTAEHLAPIRRKFWKDFADFILSRQSLAHDIPPLKHAV